jgi:hypothetical protein
MTGYLERNARYKLDCVTHFECFSTALLFHNTRCYRTTSTCLSESFLWVFRVYLKKEIKPSNGGISRKAKLLAVLDIFLFNACFDDDDDDDHHHHRHHVDGVKLRPSTAATKRHIDI